MDISNTKLTHGLLVESFKQSLTTLVTQNPLDIQTKAVILDCFNINVQKMAEQQTQKELEEYNAEQRRLEQEANKGNKSHEVEVSE